MKNCIDGFYELIHKNSLKRRRMVSLLLVLSIFVSSGVLWGLRDTGITMVNEAQCGFEEHIHTDECYEYVLVCGLEENEEHTHTPECYERRLICGYEEHKHSVMCYTGEEPIEKAVAEDEIYALSGIIDEAEEVLVTDLPELTLDNEVEALADGDDLPPTIETIDNIAEGIKFTLFDYGDSSLESQNNHYGYHWNDSAEIWEHPNANTTDGINSGRDYTRDILFLAYGTPVSPYCNDPNCYNHRDENGYVIDYMPDMNSYSGDYEATRPYSGNRPVSGIVDSNLGADGYPHVAVSGNSLDYLFAPRTNVGGDQSAYKTVYTDVNRLLQKDGNFLTYNSDKNYAYFNTDTKEFDVYNTTYEIINDNHHYKDDINNIKFDSDGNPIKYDERKDPGFKIGFFPFDQYDESRKDPNYDGNGFNHHFGMTMEASFTNPEEENLPVNESTGKKEPITFKYSGDDDMWVFVDGRLILDIGGIHEPTGGMIDFTNGLVWVQDNEKGISLNDVKTQITGWSIITDDDEWEDLPKPIGINTSEQSSDKWIVSRISDFYDDGTHNWNASKIGEHEIKMFYLERGGCYSNLAMEMNLPTLKPLTVKKDVDYKHHYIDNLYDDLDYSFQVWEWDKTNGIWVIPQGTDSHAHFYLPDNHFTLKAGERKTFEGLGQDRKFKIVEEGVDPNIFDEVTVNDVHTDIINGNASTEGAALSEVNSYTFNNSIAEELTDVTVKKLWDGSQIDDFTVKFRIMRTDSVTGEVKQVALQEGNVKKRTFSITSAEWASGVTKTGLLKRYGNHFYTYSVEELNVPIGYKPSYGADGDVLTITNTDIHKVDINVKKEWKNTAANDLKVRLKLTRSRVGYEASQPTDLTINIQDEMGNLIKTQTITTGDEHKLYAGGSAEIAYVLPKGVELYGTSGSYVKSPDSLGVKFEDDENILVVSNLADSGNVVTFKVTNDKAEDDLLLIHNSFTDLESTNGWTVQNDPSKGTNAKVHVTDQYNYAKGSALEVYDRTKAFNGAVLYLDPAKFHGNKTYTFSAYVCCDANDQFKMTFNNGLGDYRPISNYTSVPAGTWTKITGTLQLPAEIDPYNMFIIIETRPGDNESCASSKFLLDEFVAIEGTDSVNVDETTGVVSVGEATSAGQVYYHQFDGLGDGWTVRDYEGSNNSRTQTGAPENDPGGHYVRVWNRDRSSDGIQRQDVSFLQPGHTYRFKVGAQRAGNNGANNVHLTLHVPGGVVYNGGTTEYPWVSGEVDISRDSTQQYPDYVWGESEGFEITIPANANINNMDMYFETNNDTGPFRIRYVEVTEVSNSSSGSGLDDISGYDETTGQYVSDYSNYDLVLDEDSVTNPLHLLSDVYAEETGWERVVELDSDDAWEYYWKNHDIPTTDPHYISEDNNYLYQYHIEEVAILDSAGNPLDLADYQITYSGNDVATNDKDNPITVTNKYIWYKLPATGGRGTAGIYFLGAALTTLGLLSGCAVYRRRRRYD